MDIETIARKLEPLMPAQVQHWLRARDMADSTLRSLIDREILTAAHRLFGDFRQRMLLSLPPAKLISGPIHLGSVIYERDKWPCGLSSSELLQNLAIFGRSGAGKTNVTFHIVQQLASRNIPFLFLDWKRTARHLLPSLGKKVNVYTPGRPLAPFVFSPFNVPPGLERRVFINHIVDVMADAYTLGDGARSLLQKALDACYQRGGRAPDVAELLREVENLPAKNRMHGWKISTMRAIESLAFSQIAGTETTTQEQLARALLQESSIIELDALSSNGKKFLIPMLCLWLYYAKLASPDREKLRLVIIVEEAHHVLYRHEQRAKESLMNMLLRQCREIGIGIIVIDQHPHLISSAALGNTYTTICLNLKDPSDVNRAAGLALLDDHEKEFLSMLPVGLAVVKMQDRWRKPFLVQFPLVDMDKGAVNDALLARFIKDGIPPLEFRQLRADSRRQHQALGTGDRYLTEDEFVFLHDVFRHTDDGVDARYKRLGMSGDRGNRVKNALVERGWLQESVTKTGRTRRRLLSASPDADRLLGREFQSLPSTSLIHEYWKRRCAGLLQDHGYKVHIEAPRKNGHVDVLGTKDGCRVGVEVETGKSDVVSNVRSGLLSGFDEVIVVATSSTAYDRVVKQLAEAGLLIGGRVEVVDGAEFSVRLADLNTEQKHL